MKRLEKDIIIMNFSHVYEDEEALQQPDYQWIDCTAITGTDCFLAEEAERKIKEKIKGYPPEGIHFIDSGNYHYVSKLWTDKIKEPFSLVVFDHHTDSQPGLFFEGLSCGSWIKAVLDENRYIKRVILLGVKEELMGQIEEKYRDRITCYGERQMEEAVIKAAILQMQLKEKLYISVDKDVLSKSETVTNWDQGSLSLATLEHLLYYIMEREEVIGIDICGEAAMSDPLLLRRQEDAINNKVNEELLAVLARAEQEGYEEVSNY